MSQRHKTMRRLGGPIDACFHCKTHYRRPQAGYGHNLAHHIQGRDGVLRLMKLHTVCSKKCGIAAQRVYWEKDNTQHRWTYSSPALA